MKAAPTAPGPRRRRWPTVVAGAILVIGASAGVVARSQTRPAVIARERLALRFGDEERAAEAARRLGELDARSAIGGLAAFIERAPSRGAEAAYHSLARIGDPAAIPFLRRAADGQIAYADQRLAGLLKAEDRKWALIALVALGDADAEAKVIDEVANRDGKVLARKDFALALGASPTTRATEALERAARDGADDRNVRLAAFKALALSEDPVRRQIALDVLPSYDDPRLLDGAIRFAVVGGPAIGDAALDQLVRSRPEPLRTASLLLVDDAEAWKLVESRSDGLGPSIEDALYTLASARAVTTGSLRARVDQHLCRLAGLRQGANIALPEEARERRAAGIAQAIEDACR